MDFTKILIQWYACNKRELPWRNTRNPYFIWLSEIILQQTRVDQGITYYMQFTKEFPSIRDLASGNINFSGFLIKFKTLLLADLGPKPGILAINLIRFFIS